MATQSLSLGSQHGAAASSSATASGPSATASRDELATALQLVRATSLQTARLQLAILCREPQPVLESFDTLAAMDREIEHFVNAIVPPDRPDSPASGAPLRDLAVLIAGQKASLASEKMTLVSGNSGPLFRETAPDMSAQPSNAEMDHSTTADSGIDMAPSEYRPSGRLAKILALFTIVLLVAGAGAWFTVVAM